MEAVAVEVAKDRAIFSDTRNAHSAGPLFPLSVPRIRYWLRYELLRYYFQSVRIEQKRRAGEIEVTRHENGISYDATPTWEDIQWITSQVEAHIHDSEAEVRRRVQGSIHETLRKLDMRLSTDLNILEKAGIETIESHPFGNAVKLWTKLWQTSGLQLEETCEFVEKIFTYTFPIIRKIVRHNFPTLAHEFQSLSRPFTCIAAVNLEREDVYKGATLYLCEPDLDQEDVRFVARNHSEIRTRIVREPAFRFEIFTDGVWRSRLLEGSIGQRHIHFSSLFRPRHSYLEPRSSNRPYTAIYPVIRALVYDWIRAEVAVVYDALCKKYDVQMRERDWNLFVQPKN